MKQWDKDLSNGSISPTQAIVWVCSKFVMTKKKYQKRWGLAVFSAFCGKIPVSKLVNAADT